MLKKLVSIAVCYSLFSCVQAAEYWSAGSFGSEANANVERDRIQQATGLQVEVSFNEDLNLYRILIAKDNSPTQQKRLIERAGISPWTLNTDEEMETNTHREEAKEYVKTASKEKPKVKMAEPKAKPVPPVRDPVAALAAPKPKANIRAPSPGESYLDYCLLKANQFERKVYCGDSSFNDLVVQKLGLEPSAWANRRYQLWD